ncbi:MAG TPA: MFS transporter [Opitutaceae bacterium]|nr:MFS transporter [Opitutaceae bacterium]
MSSTRSLRVRVFAATWLSYVGFYFCRKNFSVLMPILERDERITSAQLADVLFVYSLCYLTGQFTSGLLSDRWGARRVVTGGMLVSAAVTAMLGWHHSFLAIVIAQGINGYAQACGWPGLLKMMAGAFDSRSRGVVMGWWTTNYVIGGFFATVFATWAATGPLMVALGWERGAWWPAVALVVAAVTFYLLSRSFPQSGTERVHAFAGLREVLQNRAVNIIAGMYFVLKMARYVFLFWLPLYMTQRLGYQPDEAGYTSSVFEIAGFVGAVLAGYVSDRLARGRRFPIGTSMMILLAALFFIYPTLSPMGRGANIIGIALIGMMLFGTDTLMTGAAVQDLVRTEVTATAGGYTNAVGSAGQLVSPFIASIISMRFGWAAVFYLLVGTTIVGAGVLATQWNHRRPGVPAPAPVTTV